MQVFSITIIVIICYLIGVFLKFFLKRKKEFYKLIPVTVGLAGAFIGYILYYFDSKFILNVDNIWNALEVGFVSGLSSTGTNELIKKLIRKVKVM